LENGLNSDSSPTNTDVKGRRRKTIGEVARKLMVARPFRSPSHLAAAVAQAVGPSDRETTLLGAAQETALNLGSALPVWSSDAVSEEPFARLCNATTLSSRHFRIHVQAETIARRPVAMRDLVEEPDQVVGKSIKVYDVFLNPIRDDSGKIISTQLQVLNVRSL